MASTHFEPFVHLAGLDDDQALIAWGGFWFTPFGDGKGMRIVDDEELPELAGGRTDSIGARSQPYGEAVVEVFTDDGELAGRATTSEHNYVWVRGLRAATNYRYEITVDGEPWVPDECRTWHLIDGERGELRPAGRTYDCRFRTFPDPGERATVRVAAIGDYGVGIQGHGDEGRHQMRLARALAALHEAAPLDLVLTLGDNIYHEEDSQVGGTGQEDDDWYFSFYEPYRFLISQVPFYPAVGNHDADETESADDRDQLADNHFTRHRFLASVEADRASVRMDPDEAEHESTEADDSGLFYRFSCGALAEFVAVDTSEAGALEEERFFDEEHHRQFLDETFDPDRHDRKRWLVPFGHHPPFCAGPKHHNDDDQIRALVPRYRAAGVGLVLAGHEHNFQHNRVDGIDYVVSGAGGKLRTGDPDGIDDAGTLAYAAEPHLLLVEIAEGQVRVLPFTGFEDGEPVPLEASTPDGEPASFPIVVGEG